MHGTRRQPIGTVDHRISELGETEDRGRKSFSGKVFAFWPGPITWQLDFSSQNSLLARRRSAPKSLETRPLPLDGRAIGRELWESEHRYCVLADPKVIAGRQPTGRRLGRARRVVAALGVRHSLTYRIVKERTPSQCGVPESVAQ